MSLYSDPVFEATDDVATDYSENFIEADDVFAEEPRRTSDFTAAADSSQPRFQPIEGKTFCSLF